MKKLYALLLVLVMVFSFASMAHAEEKITIELFYSPWASTPHDGVDPYEAYLEEKYNCDFILTPATDFETQLYSRATAGDIPDLILFGNMSQLRNIYDQGLLLDDWTEYLAKMPQTSKNISDLALGYLTKDGKVIACPSYPGGHKWCFMIRQDWLENLGLSMPTSDEEFLDVLRAFTFDDPDGDGENNTYGITSAGGNTGTGEIANLKLMYSAPSFYLDADGNVSHALLDGGYLSYLQLARTIVSEGLIDPDWYTQGWDERKPNLYAGKYGITWYPPAALLNENAEAVSTEEVLKRWAVMPMYQGGLEPQPIIGAMRSVSAKAAADPAKMDIITQYLENCAYPNEDFFIIRKGYKIDGYDVFMEIADNVYYLGMSSPDNPRARSYGSIMYGWGQMVQSGATEVEYFFANAAEPTELVKAEGAMLAQWDAAAKYGAEYLLLNPDATLKADSDAMISEFEIDFILGNVNEDNYDAFVAEWLELYGQKLLDDAAETYRAYGLID